MSPTRLLLPLLAGLAASSCMRPPATSAPAVPPAAPMVRTWGALRTIMHEGSTEPRVALAELTAGPHLYAVGALSGLRGEVTVVDGRVWLSYRGDDGGARVLRGEARGEEATLLVAARVCEWKAVPLPEDIAAGQLDERLEALARAHGVDVEQPFPLLIEGRLAELDWHIVDGRRLRAGGSHEDHARSGVSGSERDVEGVLVGFFSRHHQGVFTHRGQRTHLHVVLPSGPVMGHADRVALRAGSTLKLPVR